MCGGGGGGSSAHTHIHFPHITPFPFVQQKLIQKQLDDFADQLTVDESLTPVST